MKEFGYMILAIIIIILFIPAMIVGTAKKGDEKIDSSENVDISGSVIVGHENKDEENKEKNNKEELDVEKDGELNIKVFIHSENKTVYMPLEEYIRGVLCGEMPAEFEIESLKAQAVAARTYAVTRMKKFGSKGCQRGEDADICTDSTHCQAWVSKEKRMESWGALNGPKYWDKVTEAVNETKGQILIFGSAPVMYPLYFSTSSGKTENSEDIFKSNEPYLKSVVSPYEKEAPKFASKVTFTINDFIKKFADSEYKIKLDKSNIKSQVKILSRTEGGSVKSIKIGTSTLSGTSVRSILKLNSANFTIEFGKNDVTFSVSGYGHGVGMSQWGANGMAKQGKNYKEILKYYYQGTDIKTINDMYRIGAK